ncbi:hypothetical protein GCM10010106_39470 [Thermopolyspora flexuosa]|nr:hypothetical protein GCM10010106_39470 [Thermopolyspora flexuosa]
MGVASGAVTKALGVRQSVVLADAGVADRPISPVVSIAAPTPAAANLRTFVDFMRVRTPIVELQCEGTVAVPTTPGRTPAKSR